MKSLKEQISSYSAYHRDPRNKIIHFIGIPLVTFSLFLFLGWFRWVHAPERAMTGATLFYVIVFVYYLKLDWGIALLQAPFTLLLLWLADRAALLPWNRSLAIFLLTFVVGWIIQLIGHRFEGKKPALTDNILQIFNAPLFLTVEALSFLGIRKDLQS